MIRIWEKASRDWGAWDPRKGRGSHLRDDFPRVGGRVHMCVACTTQEVVRDIERPWANMSRSHPAAEAASPCAQAGPCSRAVGWAWTYMASSDLHCPRSVSSDEACPGHLRIRGGREPHPCVERVLTLQEPWAGTSFPDPCSHWIVQILGSTSVFTPGLVTGGSQSRKLAYPPDTPPSHPAVPGEFLSMTAQRPFPPESSTPTRLLEV